MGYFNERVKEIKSQESTDFLKIDKDGVSASVRPIDLSKETAHLLTVWRKKYWHGFFTKFEPTEERTRKWLKEKVIEDPNRILFLILSKNKKVGHIGLYNYQEESNSAEISNVLVGDKGNSPGLMEIVTKALIKCGFDDFRLSKIWLEVFSDNYKAINLYERCGMLTVGNIPLKRYVTPDGWEWKKVRLENENEYSERSINIMQITVNDYKKRINF